MLTDSQEEMLQKETLQTEMPRREATQKETPQKEMIPFVLPKTGKCVVFTLVRHGEVCVQLNLICK